MQDDILDNDDVPDPNEESPEDILIDAVLESMT